MAETVKRVVSNVFKFGDGFEHVGLALVPEGQGNISFHEIELLDETTSPSMCLTCSIRRKCDSRVLCRLAVDSE